MHACMPVFSGMVEFGNQDDVVKYLKGLGGLYAQYAGPLWVYGVRASQELANASSSTLRSAGVTNDLHNDHIRATAAAGG